MRLRSALVRQQRCVLFAAMAMLATPAVTASDATAQSKGKNKRRINVSRCVKYTQARIKEGISVHLENRCGIELSCGVTWVVRCQSTPKLPHHAGDSFVLAKAASHLSEATSAACGDDGWEIDRIRWSCRAVD